MHDDSPLAWHSTLPPACLPGPLSTGLSKARSTSTPAWARLAPGPTQVLRAAVAIGDADFQRQSSTRRWHASEGCAAGRQGDGFGRHRRLGFKRPLLRHQLGCPLLDVLPVRHQVLPRAEHTVVVESGKAVKQSGHEPGMPAIESGESWLIQVHGHRPPMLPYDTAQYGTHVPGLGRLQRQTHSQTWRRHRLSCLSCGDHGLPAYLLQHWQTRCGWLMVL